MAENLSGITSNNTMDDLITLANDLAQRISTVVVTANNSTDGALTTGNAYVSGIFGASTLFGGVLRGGNVSTSANLVVTSNLVVNAGSGFIVGNSTVKLSANSTALQVASGTFTTANIGSLSQNLVTMNSNQVSIADLELTTTGATPTTIDSYPLSIGRSAEYLIQVKDNAANGFQSSKVLVTHDGVNPYVTEYGLLYSNSVLMTYQATANATTFSLLGTPTSTNTSVRAVRVSLGA